MFLINFNQWKCACVGTNNLVILLRARYKCNHDFEYSSIYPYNYWYDLCVYIPIGLYFSFKVLNFKISLASLLLLLLLLFYFYEKNIA